MQPSPRNGRPMPRPEEPDLPAPSSESPNLAGADSAGEGQILQARPGGMTSPERSSREALMDCYNG